MSGTQRCETYSRALPQAEGLQDKIFVIKIGGDVCQSVAAMNNIAQQIATAHTLGLRIVVLHGGGVQGTLLAERLGVETSFVAGKRITSPQMLDVQKMVVRGKINTDLVSVLLAHGVRSVGLSGVDGHLVVAKKQPPVSIHGNDVDFGEVGEVVRVNPEVLHTLISAGFVPVVASLSVSTEGYVYNTNADSIATHIAIAMQAHRVIFVTSVDGVLRDRNDPSTVFSELSIDQAEELIESGVIQGGMIPKIQNCIMAVMNGIHRAHIINGLVRDSLLTGLFTKEGRGTWVLPPFIDDSSGSS